MTKESKAACVLTLDEVKGLVEARFPAPLAAVARRCRVAPRADLGGRHKLLIDLFEAYVKFMCVAFMQEARSVCPSVRERLPQKEKTLEFLKHPSTGGWVSLLRTLCDTDFSDAPGVWMPQIADWYVKPRTAERMTALVLLGQIDDLAFENRTSTPHAETINALVTYRNKHLAHAATFTDEVLNHRLPLLEGALAYLLQATPFFGDMVVFYTERIEVLENDRWLVHARRLEALGDEPVQFTASTKLEKSEVYLTDTAGGELASPPVLLSPFLLWLVNPERKLHETYFYNDAWRTKLEYVSYESGTHYYHHELHSGFQDLITLKLAPGVSSDTYARLSPEERSENAERLYKQSLRHLESDRQEDAIECLENSAEYEPRAETFIQMARIQHRLNDPSTAVLQTIERVFEVDPSNAEAFLLRRTVEDGSVGDAVPLQPGGPRGTSLPTVLHALTPRSIRDYALLWWISLYAAWYAVSAVFEWLTTGVATSVAPRILQFTCATGVFCLIIPGRSFMERQRRPLSLQLQSMRLDRFERWFDEQLENVFGILPHIEGRFDYRSAGAQSRGQAWGWLASFLVLETACLFLSGSHLVPLWLLPVRVLDYGILTFLGFPVLRHILVTTLFVYQVSRLSLKPALTTLNDDGLRAFGPMMVFNVMVVCVIYPAYWLLASLVVTTRFPIDFFFLGVTSFFVSVWGMGMPLMLRRTMRESKSHAVHAYCDHIEKAFKLFLEHPGEEELKRYQWLVQQQKVIRRISTWPLTLPQTLLTVLGANVTGIAVDVWYVGVRLRWWAHFIPGVTQ